MIRTLAKSFRSKKNAPDTTQFQEDAYYDDKPYEDVDDGQYYDEDGMMYEDPEARQNFLTAPATGWLHDDFALSYGEGVYYSFPVAFLGTIELEQSLRTVEFQFRNKIVQDAISRVRDASRMRPPSKRVVSELAEEFLGPQEPELSMLDINLSISTAGIVISNSTQESVIENHRMANISFAAGGDFEDYEVVAYVSKVKGNRRKCFVFDCGPLSNQVLATIGQAFVSAGEEQEPNQEYQEIEQEYQAQYSEAERVYDSLPSRMEENKDGFFDDNPTVMRGLSVRSQFKNSHQRASTQTVYGDMRSPPRRGHYGTVAVQAHKVASGHYGALNGAAGNYGAIGGNYSRVAGGGGGDGESGSAYAQATPIAGGGNYSSVTGAGESNYGAFHVGVTDYDDDAELADVLYEQAINDLGDPGNPDYDLARSKSPMYDQARSKSPMYDQGRSNSPMYDQGRSTSPMYDQGRSQFPHYGQASESQSEYGQGPTASQYGRGPTATPQESLYASADEISRRKSSNISNTSAQGTSNGARLSMRDKIVSQLRMARADEPDDEARVSRSRRNELLKLAEEDDDLEEEDSEEGNYLSIDSAAEPAPRTKAVPDDGAARPSISEFYVNRLNQKAGSISAATGRKMMSQPGWTFIDPDKLKQ
eukprot:m.221646 g.221646  ORF g.221646 m.221646 type:complete len:647 (-) comp10810_c0_seq3:1774-3714(-)